MNGTELRAKFDMEWGVFRRILAAHPLTGFWCALAVGTALGWFAHAIH